MSAPEKSLLQVADRRRLLLFVFWLWVALVALRYGGLANLKGTRPKVVLKGSLGVSNCVFQNRAESPDLNLHWKLKSGLVVCDK